MIYWSIIIAIEVSMSLFLFFIGAWIFSFLVCRALSRRPYILADIPNQRSGHQRIVSRGGALAFVLPSVLFLFSSLFIFFPTPITGEAGQGDKLIKLALSLACGAFFFSLLGFLDDCYRLSALARFCLSLLFCSLVCFWGLGSGSEMKGELLLGGFSFSGWAVPFFQILWLLSCINFFNFMDGMDGLAALQAWWIALVTSLGLSLDLKYLSGSGSELDRTRTGSL